ncbi:MAG: hypothetical protein MAG795_00432 [Candidatus Woesearchaeota archaeon]|nr:hypothetical protein [Candidatus Woesearchaeota archaeon]
MHYDLVFTVYRIKLDKKPNVTLNKLEHTDYRWVTPEECTRMPNLIHTMNSLLRSIYQ